MGWLGKFFGSTPGFEERVWMTSARKLEDIVSRVHGSVAAGAQPIVIAHFRATGRLLEEALKKAGIEAEVTGFDGLASKSNDIV